MSNRRLEVLLPRKSGEPNLYFVVVEEGWPRSFCLLLSHTPGDITCACLQSERTLKEPRVAENFARKQKRLHPAPRKLLILEVWHVGAAITSSPPESGYRWTLNISDPTVLY